MSRSGFYSWLTRATSDRAKEDAELSEIIKRIRDEHEGRWGIDRLVAELAKLGRRHSPKRVRRLVRAAGLSCVHPRPYRATTVRDEANPEGLVDLLGRDLVPEGQWRQAHDAPPRKLSRSAVGWPRWIRIPIGRSWSLP